MDGLRRIPVRMRLPRAKAADRMCKVSGRVLLDIVLHFLPRPLRITNPCVSKANGQQPSNHRSIRSRRLQFTDKRGCFVCHLFALDELADFDPDIGERIQQAGIRWSNFRGKEFNDAQDSL